MFAARLDSLRAVRGFVEDYCAAAGIATDTCLRLNLVLEELFTNTVRHGHREDSDTVVWLRLAREGDRLKIAYEDNAPAFNPYAWLAASQRGELPQKPGGLGILLTRELAASREYGYIFGRNVIRLGMRLG